MDRQDRRVVVLLSPPEYRAYSGAADRERVSLSEWFRRAADVYVPGEKLG